MTNRLAALAASACVAITVVAAFRASNWIAAVATGLAMGAAAAFIVRRTR